MIMVQYIGFACAENEKFKKRYLSDLTTFYEQTPFKMSTNGNAWKAKQQLKDATKRSGYARIMDWFNTQQVWL